jgi:phosphoribosylformylglycinamidine synthase
VLQTEHVVAMQDLGAAGLTSSTVECASKGGVGIEIDVQKVSRREQGMNAYEVMLSESQERMLVVIREQGLPAILEIFERWDLHADVIGQVTDDGHVRVLDGGEIVADVPATYYTDECPTYVRMGVEAARTVELRAFDPDVLPDLMPNDVEAALLDLLASPNICSREPIIRTYDHTIMSNTTLAPLDGDAAVVRIKGTGQGLAVKTDCNPRYVFLDPFVGGQLTVAEAARNVSCTGATPLALTNCLNFGSPERPEIYFQLQQVVLGMAKAAEALRTPVVSGNVSLYNEAGGSAVLPTPTVGMVGLIENVEQRVGMHAPTGSVLLLLGERTATLGASEYLACRHNLTAGAPPALDLDLETALQELTRELINSGVALAAHDTSEGGLLVALCEMVFGTGLGFEVEVDDLLAANDGRLNRTLFGEAASRVIIAVAPEQVDDVLRQSAARGVTVTRLGTVGGDRIHVNGVLSLATRAALEAWASGLML